MFLISMGFFCIMLRIVSNLRSLYTIIIETFAVNVMCNLRDGPLFDSGIRDALITCSILCGPLMSKSVFTRGHQTGHDRRNHGQ